MLSTKHLDLDLGILEFQLEPELFHDLDAVVARLHSMCGFEQVEKQIDADLETWLLKLADHDFLLKAEHYSQALWLEATQVKGSRNQLQQLAAEFETR
ncbi:MAG: DUF3630 family protein [Vibrio sp.]